MKPSHSKRAIRKPSWGERSAARRSRGSTWATRPPSTRRKRWATSSGTKAVLAASRGGAGPIFTVSFLNLGSVARLVFSEMSGKEKPLSIICSGTLGKPSLEDFACAGALAKRVVALAGNEQLLLGGDTERAIQVFESYKGNVGEILETSPHGQDLKSMGFGEDLRRCAALDSLDVVPVFDGSAITAHSQR